MDNTSHADTPYRLLLDSCPDLTGRTVAADTQGGPPGEEIHKILSDRLEKKQVIGFLLRFQKQAMLIAACFVTIIANAQEALPTQVGTAFVVAAPDYLVTALHVVRGQNQILVGPVDGRRFVKAVLLASDEANDLALLRAPVSRAPLDIALWDSVPIGLEVFVMGYNPARCVPVD